VAHWAKTDLAWAFRAAILTALTAGTRAVARMPMMAITTSNSMRVKP